MRRFLLALGLAVALSLPSSRTHAGIPAVASRQLPSRLTDQEFWRLSVDSSEPNGYFRSENLTSNELLFEAVKKFVSKR